MIINKNNYPCLEASSSAAALDFILNAFILALSADSFEAPAANSASMSWNFDCCSFLMALIPVTSSSSFSSSVFSSFLSSDLASLVSGGDGTDSGSDSLTSFTVSTGSSTGSTILVGSGSTGFGSSTAGFFFHLGTGFSSTFFSSTGLGSSAGFFFHLGTGFSSTFSSSFGLGTTEGVDSILSFCSSFGVDFSSLAFTSVALAAGGLFSVCFPSGLERVVVVSLGLITAVLATASFFITVLEEIFTLT